MLWSFAYHEGKAMKTAVVEASSEALAYRVAVKWCETQGSRYRAPATVRALVVADESILGGIAVAGAELVPEAVTSEEMASGVVAPKTSAFNRLKEMVGGGAS